MEGNEFSSELSSFINSGIYRLDGSNIVFLDPVRILNGSYTRFMLSPSAYYSRSFKSKIEAQSIAEPIDSSNSKKKKKRKRKAPRDLNERELAAEQRHQEVRPLLVNAHSALLGAAELLRFLPNVVKGEGDSVRDESEEELNFIELASHSDSSSYEISLRFGTRNTREEVEELAHREGALVALWMTNRDKLRMFVENELFPAWGVTHVTTLYWLKVKPDGSLIGELDLFHHRSYESLLIGYINMKSADSSDFTCMQNNRVIISIPGAYSRKPLLEKLLRDHIPGPRPARCLELFARELVGGWTSWGNEPLRFQDAKYFVEKILS